MGGCNSSLIMGQILVIFSGFAAEICKDSPEENRYETIQFISVQS